MWMWKWGTSWPPFKPEFVIILYPPLFKPSILITYSALLKNWETRLSSCLDTNSEKSTHSTFGMPRTWILAFGSISLKKRKFSSS